jgi:Holliday junction resolvasome RuvABC endonuclease subunit
LNKEFTLLGIDPSLAKTGLCLAKCHQDHGITDIVGLKLIKTDSAAEKGKKNKHDLFRAKSIWKDMQLYLAMADFVASETPQIAGDVMQSRSIWTSGIMFGLLATITHPLIQVSALEVKIAATGNRKASKKEMIEWAFKLFPDAPWLYKKVHDVRSPILDNEHIADAMGVVKAAFDKLKESNFNHLDGMSSSQSKKSKINVK